MQNLLGYLLLLFAYPVLATTNLTDSEKTNTVARVRVSVGCEPAKNFKEIKSEVYLPDCIKMEFFHNVGEVKPHTVFYRGDGWKDKPQKGISGSPITRRFFPTLVRRIGYQIINEHYYEKKHREILEGNWKALWQWYQNLFKLTESELEEHFQVKDGITIKAGAVCLKANKAIVINNHDYKNCPVREIYFIKTIPPQVAIDTNAVAAKVILPELPESNQLTALQNELTKLTEEKTNLTENNKQLSKDIEDLKKKNKALQDKVNHEGFNNSFYFIFILALIAVFPVVYIVQKYLKTEKIRKNTIKFASDEKLELVQNYLDEKNIGEQGNVNGVISSMDLAIEKIYTLFKYNKRFLLDKKENKIDPWRSWTKDKRLLAAIQVICRLEDIDSSLRCDGLWSKETEQAYQQLIEKFYFEKIQQQKAENTSNKAQTNDFLNENREKIIQQYLNEKEIDLNVNINADLGANPHAIENIYKLFDKYNLHLLSGIKQGMNEPWRIWTKDKILLTAIQLICRLENIDSNLKCDGLWSKETEQAYQKLIEKFYIENIIKQQQEDSNKVENSTIDQRMERIEQLIKRVAFFKYKAEQENNTLDINSIEKTIEQKLLEFNEKYINEFKKFVLKNKETPIDLQLIRQFSKDFIKFQSKLDKVIVEQEKTFSAFKLSRGAEFSEVLNVPFNVIEQSVANRLYTYYENYLQQIKKAYNALQNKPETTLDLFAGFICQQCGLPELLNENNKQDLTALAQAVALSDRDLTRGQQLFQSQMHCLNQWLRLEFLINHMVSPLYSSGKMDHPIFDLTVTLSQFNLTLREAACKVGIYWHPVITPNFIVPQHSKEITTAATVPLLFSQLTQDEKNRQYLERFLADKTDDSIIDIETLGYHQQQKGGLNCIRKTVLVKAGQLKTIVA